MRYILVTFMLLLLVGQASANEFYGLSEQGITDRLKELALENSPDYEQYIGEAQEALEAQKLKDIRLGVLWVVLAFLISLGAVWIAYIIWMNSGRIGP